MSETVVGYVCTQMLCVHCTDHAQSNELFPLKEGDVLARDKCAVCGRTLRKALKDGPVKAKPPSKRAEAKVGDGWVDLQDGD